MVEENDANKSSVSGQLDQWLLNGVLIYLLLATCNKLNELSGIYQHAVIAFYVDGEAKESDGEMPLCTP